MKYEFNTTCTFARLNYTNIVHSGKYEFLCDNSELAQIVDVCEYIIKPKTLNEIKKFAATNGINEEIIIKMMRHKIIIPHNKVSGDLANKNKLYLDLLLKNSATLNLREQHILIIGCGGIGNFMSYALTGIGVKEITLVDDDTIEHSNLNRQFMFDISNIGMKKVDVLEGKLKNINPDLVVHKYDEKVNEKILDRILNNNSNINMPTFIVLSADDFYCLKLINEFSMAKNVSYLNIGYSNDISIIGPFVIPRTSSCVLCSDKTENSGTVVNDFSDNELLKKIEKLNSMRESCSFFTNNALASSMAINDIMYYFAGENDKINSLNRRVGIDNHTFERYYLDIPKNDKCSCSDYEVGK